MRGVDKSLLPPRDIRNHAKPHVGCPRVLQLRAERHGRHTRGEEETPAGGRRGPRAQEGLPAERQPPPTAADTRERRHQRWKQQQQRQQPGKPSAAGPTTGLHLVQDALLQGRVRRERFEEQFSTVVIRGFDGGGD